MHALSAARLRAPLVALAAALAATASAQGPDCDAVAVPVFDQSDVDRFDCTELSGTLQIGPSDGPLDLAGLSELTTVGGDVVVFGNAALVSLTGLDNLTTIGGTLEIGNPRLLGVRRNDALADLTGLGGLTSAGGLTVHDNPALRSLEGIENLSTLDGDLFLAGNPVLAALDGLDGLTTVSGNVDIGARITIIGSDFVGDNPALASIDGLQSLASVGGSLTISRSPALESLDGLETLATVGGGFRLEANETLASVGALGRLTSVGGWLDVRNLPALSSLAGLEALASVGILTIVNAPALASIAELESLTSVDRHVTIAGTALTSLEGLDGLTAVDGGGITIAANPSLTSLRGLENLTSTAGLSFGDNPLLTSLAELSALTALGRLTVSNDVGDDGDLPPPEGGLESLAGLEGVTSIPGGVEIFATGALASLDGLDNLTSIGQEVQILNNTALASLGALGALTFIGGSAFITSNPALPSLDGMENVVSIGFLGVFENEGLTDCACGLRGVITGDPLMFTGVAGGVSIMDNAPGGLCTSPEVVLGAVPSCAERDTTPPVCTGALDGATFAGRATDALADDPNNTGIASLALTDAANLSVAVSLFQPGAEAVSYTARLEDPSRRGSGVVVATDGEGNTCQTPIEIPGATPIIGCTPSAPLFFSGWDTSGASGDPRGEYVEVANDAGDGTSVSLAGCDLVVFDPFAEDVIYAADASGFVADGTSRSFMEAVVGPGQAIPRGTLPAAPSAFALVQGSASVGQDVLEVLATTDVIAAVILTYDGSVFASVRGGSSARSDRHAFAAALGAFDAADPRVVVAPNPASGLGTVSFGLAESGDVRVVLYDALGREVARLAEGRRGPGRHTLPLDASTLPAGVYVVRVVAGADLRTAHVTVVR